jgi:hypothetical protein
MSAVELLRKVEALPARERKRFLLALLKLEGKPSDANRKGRRVKWPDMLIPFTPAHRAFSMEFSGQRPTTGVNGISISGNIPKFPNILPIRP